VCWEGKGEGKESKMFCLSKQFSQNLKKGENRKGRKGEKTLGGGELGKGRGGGEDRCSIPFNLPSLLMKFEKRKKNEKGEIARKKKKPWRELLDFQCYFVVGGGGGKREQGGKKGEKKNWF